MDQFFQGRSRALHGQPYHIEEKYAEWVWRSPHLLGWYEMQATDKVVYINSHMGVPGFSL